MASRARSRFRIRGAESERFDFDAVKAAGGFLLPFHGQIDETVELPAQMRGRSRARGREVAHRRAKGPRNTAAGYAARMSADQGAPHDRAGGCEEDRRRRRRSRSDRRSGLSERHGAARPSGGLGGSEGFVVVKAMPPRAGEDTTRGIRRTERWGSGRRRLAIARCCLIDGFLISEQLRRADGAVVRDEGAEAGSGGDGGAGRIGETRHVAIGRIHQFHGAGGDHFTVPGGALGVKIGMPVACGAVEGRVGGVVDDPGSVGSVRRVVALVGRIPLLTAVELR